MGPAAAPITTRLRSRATVRNLRLASGLVLFAYVLSHLINHALGNVSLEAMETGLDWVAGFWARPPASWALYGALLAHAALGLWALYARPRFQWNPAQAAQLLLGLSLPLLLTGHVVATKLSAVLYGTARSYAQLLYFFWVASPTDGAVQALALILAWGHGCLGLYFWLRLKPFFARAAPLLLCAAVLVPVLALLGYAQGGRAVVALAADEAWRIENVPVSPDESPEAAAQLARLMQLRYAILTTFGIGVAAALLGRVARRALERRRGLVRLTYPDGTVATVPRGTTVLEASRVARIPHANVCGGRGRCSTCRVKVFGEGASRLPAPTLAERAVLDRVGAGPEVRLACQLRPECDLGVAPLIPPAAAFAEARRERSASGEERFVVAMFVDMRGSTRLAEGRLPFDTVFLINRFLEAVARAVNRVGGQPNQFLGDGMLALFGLASPPDEAARSGLAATAAIGAEVAALNALMAHDLPEPIRFGIGLHAGTAVLGEIGGRESGHRVFTAIGDPVNVASRLQSLTKGLGVEALVSAAVFEAAGQSPPAAAEEVTIPGRDGTVHAHPLRRATGARDEVVLREIAPA